MQHQCKPEAEISRLRGSDFQDREALLRDVLPQDQYEEIRPRLQVREDMFHLPLLLMS